MAHALLLNPTSGLPIIVNEFSTDYAQLAFMGYTPLKTGTRKELEIDEREIMENFCRELETNDDIN